VRDATVAPAALNLDSCRLDPLRRRREPAVLTHRMEVQGMVHRMLGRVHAEIAWRLAGVGERGQGTVEYVALMLLVAALLAGVITAMKGKSDGIAGAIVKQFKDTVDGLKPGAK